MDPLFVWLRDGLGIDLPNCRVLSHGYSATPEFRFGKILSTAEFNDHVADLHAHLRLVYQQFLKLSVRITDINFQYLRSQPVSHPLIFIAHNLGGILVKQVLLIPQSTQNSNPNQMQLLVQSHAMRSLVHSCTAAIMFFGRCQPNEASSQR